VRASANKEEINANDVLNSVADSDVSGKQRGCWNSANVLDTPAQAHTTCTIMDISGGIIKPVNRSELARFCSRIGIMNGVADKHWPVARTVQKRKSAKSAWRSDREGCRSNQRGAAAIIMADHGDVVDMVIRRHEEAAVRQGGHVVAAHNGASERQARSGRRRVVPSLVESIAGLVRATVLGGVGRRLERDRSCSLDHDIMVEAGRVDSD